MNKEPNIDIIQLAEDTVFIGRIAVAGIARVIGLNAVAEKIGINIFEDLDMGDE